LEYGGKVGKNIETGLTIPKIPSGEFDWWGVALNVSSVDWLGANQSINGSIYFRIGPGLAPKELICKSVVKQIPSSLLT
jgi:hypothetical protein